MRNCEVGWRPTIDAVKMRRSDTLKPKPSTKPTSVNRCPSCNGVTESTDLRGRKSRLAHFEAYLKLIEDEFRLDQRPADARTRAPSCAKDVPLLGDLVHDFDFAQRSRARP
jgi:hypothetical protein